MKADGQLLKGHLDVLLLSALQDGPRHGYAVKEALRDGSGVIAREIVEDLTAALAEFEAVAAALEEGRT